jgi:hypothetical protein
MYEGYTTLKEMAQQNRTWFVICTVQRILPMRTFLIPIFFPEGKYFIPQQYKLNFMGR